MMLAGLLAAFFVKRLSILFLGQVSTLFPFFFFTYASIVVSHLNYDDRICIIHQKPARKDWTAPRQPHCGVDCTWYTVISEYCS